MLTASTITVDGLQFVALGGFTQNGSTYSASGTVSVGFAPGSNNTFTPVLQLTGDVSVDDVANASFSVNGKVSETLTDTPISLFQGSQSFDIDSLINDGLSQLDGLSFDVAGVGFDLDRIQLVNGGGDVPEIQLQGSLSVAGLTVTVDGPNSVDISSSGVTLTGVDATLNGSVTLGGVTFDADQLGIAYANTGGNDVFTVTGATSFAVSTSTVQVDWGGKTPKGTQTAGLVVENGSIKSLDMAVTGTVAIASLSFTAKDLVVTYTEASSTFTMTGGAEFELVQDDSKNTASNDVSVTFGGKSGGQATAGLVVVDGELTRLDMTVDASFSLFDLKLAATGLVFEYQAGANAQADQFIMYGALSLTSASQAFDKSSGKVFDGIAATLGSKASPGLVVKGGVVQDVNVTVNGSFNLFSLTVAPEALNVKYTRSTSTVALTGGLMVSLAGDFQASVELDDGGIRIDTKTGEVKVDGVVLDLSDVNLGAITIQQFELSFTQTKAQTTFDASLELTFSGGWSVGATMDFAGGEINEIGVDYSAGTSQGIELGPSGLFLTEFSTTINNIATGVLTVTGSIAVDYGPHVTINGQSVAMISASGDFLVDSSELTLTNVDVSVADGIIGSGTGSLVADWATGSYSLDASISLLDGVFQVDGSFQFDTAGDFLLVANASVNVPDAVPVIGGDSIASLNFAFKYLYNNGNPTGFIAAWDTISFLGIDESVGFEYEIDGSISSGDFSLIGDDGVENVEEQLSLPASAVGSDAVNYIQLMPGYQTWPTGLTPGQVLNVPEGATTASLVLDFPSTQSAYPVFLLTPPATTQSPSPVLIMYPSSFNVGNTQSFTFPGTNLTANFTVRQATATTIAVLIQAPAGQTLPAGQYAILYSSPPNSSSASNSFTYFQPQVSAPTTGAASEPNQAALSVSGLIAQPLAGTTTVSFYATTSSALPQGVLIGEVTQSQGGLTVGSDGSFTANLNWDLSGFHAGTYYIYTVVKDGQNPPVISANSSTSVAIEPTVEGSVTAANGAVAGATVQIYYNADPNNLPATPDQVAVTGPDGGYTFRSDQAGSPQSPLTFVVSLVVPAGYSIQTSATRTGSYTGGKAATIDYALQTSAAIVGTVTDPPPGQTTNVPKVPILGATVFLDLNHDGHLDPGEPVSLSDSHGHYGFLNLAPGTYHVVIQTPSGYGNNTPTSQDVTVADEYHRVSGIDFDFYHLNSTPASSTPVYPGGGKTFGPIMSTSISGTAFDPRGSSEIKAVLVSLQDLDTGLYWNGNHFVASPTPIQLTANGTVSWRLPISVSSLISGHSFRVGSLAVNTEGYNQASPAFQTFTYKGPATANPPTIASTTTLASSHPGSVPGQPVVFTVTVSAAAPGTGVPTGTVWLVDGSTFLGSMPLQNGRATFQVGSLSLGNHAIRAYYSGDGKFLGGSSSMVNQAVERVALEAAPSTPVRAEVGSQILAIGGAAAGSVEQTVLRPILMGRFVQVRIVEVDTGEVVYRGAFRTRSLRGIVVYNGPGVETVRTIGRLRIPLWHSQAGVLAPLPGTIGMGVSPSRGRMPRFLSNSTVPKRQGHSLVKLPPHLPNRSGFTKP
ncbi:beta strand repeat-containing protein [Singulisphaera sp. PoT]|uniref:beta strand repeat-containing protein n=1 Tax=Singulisphaera sp. PoT TaxID=3411797 RepID=UPI003BF4BCA0